MLWHSSPFRTAQAHAFTKAAAREIIRKGGRCLLLQRGTQDRVVAEYDPDAPPPALEEGAAETESASSSAAADADALRALDLVQEGGAKRPDAWEEPSVYSPEEHSAFIALLPAMLQTLQQRRRVLHLQLKSKRQRTADANLLVRRNSHKRHHVRRFVALGTQTEALEKQLADVERDLRSVVTLLSRCAPAAAQRAQQVLEAADPPLPVLNKIPRRFVHQGALPPKEEEFLRWACLQDPRGFSLSAKPFPF